MGCGSRRSVFQQSLTRPWSTLGLVGGNMMPRLIPEASLPSVSPRRAPYSDLLDSVGARYSIGLQTPSRSGRLQTNISDVLASNLVSLAVRLRSRRCRPVGSPSSSIAPSGLALNAACGRSVRGQADEAVAMASPGVYPAGLYQEQTPGGETPSRCSAMDGKPERNTVRRYNRVTASASGLVRARQAARWQVMSAWSRAGATSTTSMPTRCAPARPRRNVERLAAR